MENHWQSGPCAERRGAAWPVRAPDAAAGDSRGKRGGMYRLLIIVGLLVMFYFLLRCAIRELRYSKVQSQALDAMNLLVQDSVCRMYVERDLSVSARIGCQTDYCCIRAWA